jgi:O-antigen/teichoic acid export membrane protein
MTPPTDADPAHARSGSLRAVLQNAGLLLGGRTASAVFSLAYIAILTRTLGPETFGAFAIIVSIAQAIRAFVGFQTWQLIVRYGLGYLGSGRLEPLVRLIKFALAIELGGAIVGTALAVPAVLLLVPRFGWDDGDAWLTIAFAAAALLTIRFTPAGILRLYDRFAAAAFAETAVTLVRFVGAVAVWLSGLSSLAAYITVWAAAEAASAIVFWWSAMGTTRGLPWRATRADLRRTLAENVGLAAFAGITNVTQTFHLVGKQLPVLVVGMFVAPVAAGGFRLASQLGQAMAKVSQLTTRAIFPELMRAREFGEHAREFGALFRKTFVMSLAAGLVLLAILVFAGETLLVLIAGEAFAFAYPMLLVLGLAAIVELVGVTFEPALTAADRAGAAFRIRLLSNAVIVGGMFVVVRDFGAQGVAWVMLAGALVAFAGMALALRRAMR